MASEEDDDPNVGVAFALVVGAGAATALGAAVVFFPRLVKLASRRVLAGSLGLSAGVMMYVSFVEILQKAVISFLKAGHTPKNAYLYATLTFFGGVVTMMLIDFLVKCLSGGYHHHQHHRHEDLDSKNEQEQEQEEQSCHSEEIQVPHCLCCADDPVGDLQDLQRMADEIQHDQENDPDQYHHRGLQLFGKDETPTPSTTVGGGLQPNVVSDGNIAENVLVEDTDTRNDEEKSQESLSKKDSQQQHQPHMSDKERDEQRKLVHMGINTAVAIGLHNFPEGLATFVAALDNPKVGAVLAVAIGIHNIPEGLCVALPIYYATGNRCKAFGWALISGLSEPIAALLGWAVLANSFSDNLYACLFGIVGGMMVIISTKELLPTAHRYDPEDTVVTFSFIGGMCIMAVSLVLFKL